MSSRIPTSFRLLWFERLLSQAFPMCARLVMPSRAFYRFRGADVNVFFGYRESLEAECPEAQFVSLPIISEAMPMCFPL